MIWLRLFVIALVGLMLLIILFFLVLGEDESQQEEQDTFIPQKLAQIKKVPGIQSFIRRKSKPFNKPNLSLTKTDAPLGELCIKYTRNACDSQVQAM